MAGLSAGIIDPLLATNLCKHIIDSYWVTDNSENGKTKNRGVGNNSAYKVSSEDVFCHIMESHGGTDYLYNWEGKIRGGGNTTEY